MIEYRFATESDVENIVEAIYDIWLNQEDGSVSDAIEVSEGFAYYYRNFPDYIDHKIVLAIDKGSDKIVGLAGYLEHPLAELPGVKAAQLNPVGVRKEYRRQGIAGKCSEFLCKYLTDNGYSFLLVCGVPYLYPQIGFHSVFSFTKAEFSLPLNVEESDGVVLKKADMDTIGNILTIYQNANKGNLFALKRSEVWLERKFSFKKYKIKEFAPQVPLGAVDVDRVWFVVYDNSYIGYFMLNHADSNEVNMEEFFVTDESMVANVINEVQKQFATKKVSLHHCAVGSSVYETADKYGQVFSFRSDLFMRILDTRKLLFGMRHVLEKRIGKAIGDTDLNRIVEILDGLSEAQKTGLLAGKCLFADLKDEVAMDISEAEASMMEKLFPKHSPYLPEPDMN